ncbi:EcoRI family type II restriction endonuclease [Bombella intestini]|uniref:EcoRI family type II restriction endonuclease n=1 Tax=Bombella intestini TaxID=1539051 RepID=UPI00098782A5|nr:EcoRI family type II restriction endonuclease [Bombella intestini]
MSKKNELRVQHLGTILNARSKIQEKSLMTAVLDVVERLGEQFPFIELDHVSEWKLKYIIENLISIFPGVDFSCYFDTSSMRPDGGILSLKSNDGGLYPILISEKKNQGTNDLRLAEGKARQAKGNAIERLGKNVIGFRTAMKMEAIFPFVCFGDGCDFDERSSILDRVVTIAQFGQLNHEHLYDQGARGEFDRGTFYFRVEEWSESEMAERMYSIAEKSIYYYFSRYGKERFHLREH